MTFTREGDKVTLEMTVDDWENLLLALGVVLGASYDDKPLFWKRVSFVNELNRTNPNFAQYEIPEEFREKHSGSE